MVDEDCQRTLVVLQNVLVVGAGGCPVLPGLLLRLLGHHLGEARVRVKVRGRDGEVMSGLVKSINEMRISRCGCAEITGESS